MIVYGFLYNSCIYESAWCTISLHLSRKEAKKALWEHMKKEFLDYRNNYKKYCAEMGCDRPKFGWMEDWKINEITILP